MKYTTKEEIKKWLDYMWVEGYLIKDDLTVDVIGNVNLNNHSIEYIPFQFNEILGNFNCSENNLTSLCGVPIKVKGSFNCSNNKLTSLKYSPKIIGSYFKADYNPLISLENHLEELGSAFICHYYPNDSFNKNIGYLRDSELLLDFNQLKKLLLMDKLNRELPLKEEGDYTKI